MDSSEWRAGSAQDGSTRSCRHASTFNIPDIRAGWNFLTCMVNPEGYPEKNGPNGITFRIDNASVVSSQLGFEI